MSLRRPARRRLVATGAAFAVGASIVGVVVAGRAPGPVAPNFVDEAATAGVDHTYDGEFPFFVGGGVATFDCNDDALPDMYLAGGSKPAALYVNRAEVAGPLRFDRLESPTTDLEAVTGAYPIDLDSDGVLDLVVLRRGEKAMLRGLGACRFEDMTEQLGLDAAPRWTVGFSATWEADNALPTLAFGNYLVPDTYDCDSSELYRPDGDRYASPVQLPGHCTLSVLFSDWNHEGGTDLRVSNDRNYDRDAQEQLWRVRTGEEPREYTEADGWRPLTIWGMGIASRDLTGDGRPEVFLSSQADNKLQTLDDGATGPAYRDIALELGVTAQRPYTGGDVLPSTAWHPEFADVNNDGFVDLFIAKGNVEAQVDYAANDPNNLLLGRPDGTFVEAGADAGIATSARSRGAAVVDLNLDGMLDLVVVNRRSPVEVWRNLGTGSAAEPRATGGWIGVRLRQSAPNPDAIGAWLEVKVSERVLSYELTVGGGHASGSSGWIHFGLGSAPSALVRVTSPGGEVGPWIELASGSLWTIERGAATAEQWRPLG